MGWIYEDSQPLRFTADVPAAIIQVQHKTMTVQVTCLDGRAISVHIRPEYLHPREDI